MDINEIKTLHEGAQDGHKLIVLDTIDKITNFRRAGASIVFFSYQWLTWEIEGPNDTQLKAMKDAARLFGESFCIPMMNVFIWLDVLSIPQANRHVQKLAINSIYIFAAAVDALIIIAPDSFHRDTGEACGLVSYKSRVWTRIEQIAHVAAHCVSSVFIKMMDSLQPIDDSWLSTFVSIFDASMTCCRLKHEHQTYCDKELFVAPLLGIWYRILLDVYGGCATPGASALHRLIDGQKTIVFPKIFTFHLDETTEERELFGDLIARVERRANETASEGFTRVPTLSWRMGGCLSVAQSATHRNASGAGKESPGKTKFFL